MDLDLVGYLFDLLEPEDRARTAAALRTDPAARADLENLRVNLAPLAVPRVDEAPPPGLVDRTLALIAMKGGTADHSTIVANRSEILPAAKPVLGGDREPVFAPSRWSRLDAVIAASIFILVGGLSMSGLGQVHKQQARVVCQNNMRQVGQGLATFSLENDGRFPRITDRPPTNVAAAFVPMLQDRGCLPASGLPICPVANVVTTEPNAGGYAYTLGFRRPDGTLGGLHRADSDLLPILADQPFPISHGDGYNVLFVGGNVRFAPNPNVGVGGDHIFQNQAGVVRRGLNPNDTVLGAANDSP